ncbi:MAG: hypothetical protein ACOC5R_01555 [Elusimicrobiota bacterium]
MKKYFICFILWIVIISIADCKVSKKYLTFKSVSNAEFYLESLGEKIKLTDGTYTGAHPEKSSEQWHVKICNRSDTHFDFNNDGFFDKVIIVESYAKDTRHFYELIVLFNSNGKPHYYAGKLLNNKLKVIEMSVENITENIVVKALFNYSAGKNISSVFGKTISYNLEWDEIVKVKEELIELRTYNNKKYNFKIDYPNYYTFEKKPFKQDHLHPYRKLRIYFFDKEYKGEMVHNPGILLDIIKTNLSPRDWLKKTQDILTEEEIEEMRKAQEILHGVINVKEEVVNGMEALTYTHCYPTGRPKHIIFKGQKNILYNIAKNDTPLGAIPQEIFQRMLQSFKILNK